MGTRADFYVGGTDPKYMQWVGSIAWDGYPDGLGDVIAAETIEQWNESLAEFFHSRDDYTNPDQGWPWPWDDSGTTDYAYTFCEGAGVRASCFGHAWFDPTVVLVQGENEDDGDFEDRVAAFDYADPKVEFPDMSAVKNVDFGQRSGLIVFGL